MPLFSQKPSRSPVIVAQSQAPLTQDQKTFNTLIKKIEARRARLADWNAAMAQFRQKYVSDLLPLQEQEAELQFRLAQALDQAHCQKGLTKGEKRKLAAMIVDLAEAVLQEREHGAMKGLYNKHSRSDFDAETAAEMEGMKAMLEEILGVDLGEDTEMDSPEEVLDRIKEQFQAEEEAWQAKHARRKKSAKELAREARQAAEEKGMSQSIREVYRKLASSLHPDREPDPVEKKRKTELMQRANEAYGKGNLLQLLELQLELEHIDQAHLAAIGPQRLKHYLKILNGQLAELEMEIRHVEDAFAAEFGLSPFQRHQPKGILAILVADTAACQASIRQLQEQLDQAGDLKRLKAWLKTISRRRTPALDDDIPF